MADTKISNLTAATAAAAADLLAIVQGGVTKKLAFSALWAGGVPAAGGFAISPRCVHSGGVAATQTTDGTDATPVVTETYIVEMFVPANMTATGLALMNGSAANGNIYCGLADSNGAIIAESASTAQAGTDAYQRIPFSAPEALVGPATYYAVFQFNNTGARFNTHILGSFGASKKTGEVFATLTTITPPTAFTTALGPICSLY